MIIYALLHPWDDGDEIIGLFSTREKAEEQLRRAFWNLSHCKIEEYKVDPILPAKFIPYWEHEIFPAFKDYGQKQVAYNGKDNTGTPSEHVWFSTEHGMGVRGIGATPEEATRRAEELLNEYQNQKIEEPTPMTTVRSFERPELLKREQ